MKEITDILMGYDEKNKIYDISFDENGDFLTTTNLSMALKLSLFTDARALDSEIRIEENRRGWWGNSILSLNSDLGSKLWLVSQEKATIEVRNLSLAYINQSIDWMYDEGYADKIEAIYTDIKNGSFFCTIRVIKNGSLAATIDIKFYEGIKEDFNLII